jgi:hypothetical protein
MCGPIIGQGKNAVGIPQPPHANEKRACVRSVDENARYACRLIRDAEIAEKKKALPALSLILCPVNKKAVIAMIAVSHPEG